ncbi:hypothetical protein C491_02885 [Natronococcus amylolyticus DSM 10524]|uniref:DUF3179 domain-containing protein n=1 Tax=Natronococcus amylolyticus DSM 10524 TaxID=1227497 RepID=L9XEQ9_9EURY|nr:DUF3179 domain-containing protein [Natronococcus amylolyticus]ELY60209.1 hypothetical protein C491_02885 [Natronococcus amylolyticus DSM 10524]
MNVRQVIPRDAIPSIDEPTFGIERVGDPDDEVVVVEASSPKAYPVRVLDYHEIVNDTVDGDPIAVTWCPLCGSAVVYDRTVDDRTLEFGVSGKLADDDLVMYDRETGSEWKQSSGECIDGPLRGWELRVRPAAVLSLKSFRERYRDGLVLQPPENATSEAASDGDEPAPIDYNEAPYAGYFESDGFGLAAHRGTDDERSWDHADFGPKTVVLGLEIGSEARGFPLPRVESEGGVVHETVGGTDIVVLATGEGIHAFENPGFEFERTDDGTIRADGTAWDAATGSAADGRRLERLPARRLFAFAWRDDHGVDSFYGQP